MEQDLTIKIKGDIVQVTKSLDELQKEFKDLETQLKTKTGAAFAAANIELDRLAQTMKKVANVGRTGFDKFGDPLKKAGKDIKDVGRAADIAAPAIFSLSQVSRDLPFGFIAIQNNLPQVIDTFAVLGRTSGGLGNALKALGASLLGPAGIGFAFGAIVSVVTYLTQKYGGLGKAVDALIHSGDKLYQQQVLLGEVNKEANKNAGTEIARYEFLTETIKNSALSLEVRKDAVKELQSQYGAYLGNLSAEDILNGKLALSTAEVTKALLAKALATAAVAKAGELNSKVLDNLLEEEKLTKQITDLEIKAAKEKGTKSFGKAEVDISAETNRRIGALQKERQEIRANTQEIQAQIGVLFDLAQTKNKEAGAGAINLEAAAKKAAEAQAALDKKKREAAEALKKAQEAEKANLELKLAKIEKELKLVGKLTDKYLALSKAKAQTEADILLIGVDQPATEEKIKLQLGESLDTIGRDFNAGRIEAGRIDFTSLIDLDPIAGARKLAELMRGIGGAAAERLRQFGGGKISGAVDVPLSDAAKKSLEDLADMDKRILKISDTFGTVLAPSIESAFGALSEGGDVVKSIGESFKRLIIQIGATIVKAAILAAILSVISGGSANAAKGGVSFGKTFLSILGLGKKEKFGGPSGSGSSGGFSSLSPSVSTPSFSGTGGSGGIVVTVQGVLTGRGTELAAVLNSANQRIGRTG